MRNWYALAIDCLLGLIGGLAVLGLVVATIGAIYAGSLLPLLGAFPFVGAVLIPAIPLICVRALVWEIAAASRRTECQLAAVRRALAEPRPAAPTPFEPEFGAEPPPRTGAPDGRISVICDLCTTRFRAAPEHAGRRTKCPVCEALIVVPL